MSKGLYSRHCGVVGFVIMSQFNSVTMNQGVFIQQNTCLIFRLKSVTMNQGVFIQQNTCLIFRLKSVFVCRCRKPLAAN